MSGEEGQGRQAGKRRQAGTGKQARYTSFNALLRQRHCLGSARSRSGARASPTLPRRLSVGRVLSMPLRRPRRSSVTLVSRSASVPLEPHATPHRAAPCRAARHATPHHTARRADRADALFRKRARGRLSFSALYPSRSSVRAPSVLYSSPFFSLVTFSRSRKLATALSALFAGRLLYSVEILSFLAVFVVRSSSSPSSFQVAHVSVRSTSLFEARLHRDGNIP